MRAVSARESRPEKFAEALSILTRTRWGEVTLGENADSTEVTLAPATVMDEESLLFFDPLTANAAAELAAGTMFVALADRGRGAFTITHSNAAADDRTFRWIALGD